MAATKPPDPKERVQWHVAMTMVCEEMGEYHRAQADHYFWMNERMLASRPKAAAKAKSKGQSKGAKGKDKGKDKSKVAWFPHSFKDKEGLSVIR